MKLSSDSDGRPGVLLPAALAVRVGGRDELETFRPGTTPYSSRVGRRGGGPRLMGPRAALFGSQRPCSVVGLGVELTGGTLMGFGMG